MGVVVWNDLVVLAETEDDVITRLNEWKDNVENRGMRETDTHTHTHTHTHMHTQPFYSSLDFVRDNPGELVPEGTFRHLMDFLVQNEDNTGRRTNNPDGLPAIQTNWWPHLCHPHQFLCRMPFLAQSCQFILAWDRNQICWLAYPVAW